MGGGTRLAKLADRGGDHTVDQKMLRIAPWELIYHGFWRPSGSRILAGNLRIQGTVSSALGFRVISFIGISRHCLLKVSTFTVLQVSGRPNVIIWSATGGPSVRGHQFRV